MAIVGLVLAGIGWLMGVVGGIMMLVAAFGTGVLWGLGCLFIPFVSLFFLILHWDVAKRGFLTALAGTGVTLCGVFITFLGGGIPGAAPLSEGPDQPGLRRAFSSLAGEVKQRVPAVSDSSPAKPHPRTFVGRPVER